MSSEVRFTSLRSYLLMPLQQIPKYHEILGRLMEVTSQTHKDFGNLNKAVKVVKDIEDTINLAMKENENKIKLTHIQNSFIQSGGFQVTL